MHTRKNASVQKNLAPYVLVLDCFGRVLSNKLDVLFVLEFYGLTFIFPVDKQVFGR